MRFRDGAYGTLLAGHVLPGTSVDDLCVEQPLLVTDAHRAYLEAGARVIQTNSFLAWARDSRRRRATLYRAALECALEAFAATPPHGSGTDGPGRLLLATIGPAGSEPSAYWHDVELLLELGAPGVLCETLTSRAAAEAFIAAWDEVAAGLELPLHVGCSIAPSAGADGWAWFVELASQAPGHVQLGLNCCEGPAGLEEPLRALLELRGRGWVAPSAGLPTIVDRIPEWPLAASDWARQVTDLLDAAGAGSAIDVGGCCGTTPAAIAAVVAEASQN